MTTLKLDQFLPYRLSIVSNRVSAAVASTYQALFGLKIPEWRLVAIIAESEGATQQALGLATRMDKVTVSRAAATLVERGLVERRPNASDQRSHLLSLTEAGRTLYENVAPKALELEAQVFAGFTKAEIASFRAMLDRLETSAAPFDPERA
ncbi:MarR family transcriptional regulator [Sphingomonas sp. CARO-RG-8B-R24-01]|uniref:MarR family winged helix-turn-helix transcriptional regulator n=1 Tax=Sphingomonas sp. CARO-RG-8B-R24-01 TaxID=2914831 RepID=UPI001F57B338|nr:MarR family transcriptional regulator [Sphingomonas sp. CARO-RG-8B-R24-01]